MCVPPALVDIHHRSILQCTSAPISTIVHLVFPTKLARETRCSSSVSYLSCHPEQEQVPLDPITCDLAQPLKTRLQHSVDVILFNPPYVPTDTEEALHAQSDASISGSWAGGMDGMEITNRFLDDVEVPRNLFSPARSIQTTYSP